MEKDIDAEARKTARNHLIVGLVAAALIVALIGLLAFIESYGEKMDAASPVAHNAADS
ncbi:MAG: hypothetical protein HGA47_09015 [Zoogloea sp.]|nr:hypothetical protein [Zoogloea sp.]